MTCPNSPTPGPEAWGSEHDVMYAPSTELRWPSASYSPHWRINHTDHPLRLINRPLPPLVSYRLLSRLEQKSRENTFHLHEG